MAEKYWKLKKSKVPGKVPTLNEIDLDTIVLNQADAIAYVRKKGFDGDPDEVVALTGDGDKHLTFHVSNKLFEVINHNLGKNPAVSVVDSDNEKVIADVEYIDNDTVKVSFTDFFTGKIIFN
ncbi:MAG TPA: hypothetical protein PKE03_10180 [Bacteroidales bacterium]|jgi:hypothetical protein|nr:hypothetical protein [Bacteroidales bacterium]